MYDPNYPGGQNYDTTDTSSTLNLVMNADWQVDAAFKCDSGGDAMLPLGMVGVVGVLFLIRRLRLHSQHHGRVSHGGATPACEGSGNRVPGCSTRWGNAGCPCCRAHPGRRVGATVAQLFQQFVFSPVHFGRPTRFVIVVSQQVQTAVDDVEHDLRCRFDTVFRGAAASKIRVDNDLARDQMGGAWVVAEVEGQDVRLAATMEVFGVQAADVGRVHQGDAEVGVGHAVCLQCRSDNANNGGILYLGQSRLSVDINAMSRSTGKGASNRLCVAPCEPLDGKGVPTLLPRGSGPATPQSWLLSA
jgi:hypothetical protein